MCCNLMKANKHLFYVKHSKWSKILNTFLLFSSGILKMLARIANRKEMLVSSADKTCKQFFLLIV